MTQPSHESTYNIDKIDIVKWQHLVNIIADVYNAASGDIIQYKCDHFSVLTTSENPDNFLNTDSGWSAQSKTFCKHIIDNQQEIYINDALKDPYWHDAPFVVEGQVCSYFGHPISWPDGTIFGSFCVIDTKPTQYSEKLKNVLAQLKLVIESDLRHIWDRKALERALQEKEASQQQMMQEMTKRKATESKLDSQEAIVSATLEVLVDAVIRIDKTGQILAVNSQTEKMFGYQNDELLGQNVRTLMPQAYESKHDQYLTNYLKNNINQIIGNGRNVEAIRKNGEIFPIRLSVSELAIDDQVQFIGLIEDITEKVEYEEKLREYALFDHLTKCANRNLLGQRFDYHIAAAQRNSSRFTIAYIDLNKFKPINDTYGHKCGDHVLVSIAQRLKNNIRETDLVARVGGDEFIILFAKSIDTEKMETQLQDKLQMPIDYQGQELSVGASIGYATYPENGRTMDLLLEYADKQMYSKK